MPTGLVVFIVFMGINLMKLSTRVRYGVRAMIELAKQKNNKPMPLRELAGKQEISAKYLEHMAASLKIAGLIESVRGAEGGYRLAKPANKITILDIYNILDISGEPIECLERSCPREDHCSIREVWEDMSKNINKVLGSKNIQQLANRELKLEKACKKN